MRAAVFVGPSVPDAERLAPPGVRLCRPIARGDLPRLLAGPDTPAVVGIVDGAFLHNLAVSPKEIVEALDAGVAVYGASSMGALRAVECGPFGMVGLGRVFEEYRSGRVEADDEVAVVYDGESLRALSEPLVSWRLALRDAVAAGLLDDAAMARLLDDAKALYFPQRTRQALQRSLATLGLAEPDLAALRDFLDRPECDAKRVDALELLDVVGRLVAESGEAAGVSG